MQELASSALVLQATPGVGKNSCPRPASPPGCSERGAFVQTLNSLQHIQYRGQTAPHPECAGCLPSSSFGHTDTNYGVILITALVWFSFKHLKLSFELYYSPVSWAAAHWHRSYRSVRRWGFCLISIKQIRLFMYLFSALF